MRKSLSVSLLSASIVGVLALPAESALIDNFNAGSGFASAGPGGSDTDAEAGLGANTISGEREILIPASTPITGIGLTVRANPFSTGVLTFSLEAASAGSVLIDYDPAGPVDLTDGGIADSFFFNILAIDQGNIDLVVHLQDNLGTTANSVLSGAGVGPQYLMFTEFDPTLDLANITDIQLEIIGENASDMTLDHFDSRLIPEPSSFQIAGILMIGLFAGAGFKKLTPATTRG